MNYPTSRILTLLCFIFAVPVVSAHAVPNASTPILSATQHSGYTTPEAASETHCELDSKGFATGYAASGWNGTGWNHSRPLSFQLTHRALKKLKESIAQAKAGPYQAAGGQCDAGTYQLNAFIAGDTQPFVIASTPDCAPGQINQNPAAKGLRDWVSNLCKISY